MASQRLLRPLTWGVSRRLALRPRLLALARPPHAAATAASASPSSSASRPPGPTFAAEGVHGEQEGSDSGDATVRALFAVVQRSRWRLKDAGGYLFPDQLVDAELNNLVADLQKALHETAASPTFVRLLETSLDPCWDWAARRARLRTARVMAQALDRVERRLVQMCNTEKMADARFESLRMDLGAKNARTSGTRAAPVTGSGAAAADLAGQSLLQRQFLTNDGVAGRTQFERANNADKQRLERGTVAAAEYRAARSGHHVAAEANDLEELDARIEDKIQIAMAKGEFDNLKGKGRPLRRLQQAADNPFLDEGDRLAYDLLQKHNFLPEWIEQQKEIRRTHDDASRMLAAVWLDCGEQPSARWSAQKNEFEKSIKELNRRVRDYNLICPIAAQHMMPFAFWEEVWRIQEGARGIVAKGRPPGDSSSRSAPPPPPAKPKRVISTFREALSRGGESPFAATGGRSIWQRVADAFAFKN